MAQKFTLQKLHFSIYWKVCNDFLTSCADADTLPPAAGDNSIWNGMQFEPCSLCLTLHQVTDSGIRTQKVYVTRRKHSAPFLSCSTLIHVADIDRFCATAA